jgi:pteridine reductase
MVKVALITGAARRIGAEIARILHENSMNVIIHYHHSQDDAEKLCELFNQKRANSAIAIFADLNDPNQWKSLINQSVSAFDGLDILVNNASDFFPTPMGAIRDEDWNLLIDVNLKAPFFLSEFAAPHLKKSKGSIINIVDIHAERPMKSYSIYSISKAGLWMATKTLARELGPEIRVNAVSPGPIIWPEGENVLDDAEKQHILNTTALKRHGNPEEIAKAVLYLVRDANYVTGMNLMVDGGRSVII